MSTRRYFLKKSGFFGAFMAATGFDFQSVEEDMQTVFSPYGTSIQVFILAGQSNAVGYNHINEYTGKKEKLLEEISNLNNVIFWPGSNAKSDVAKKWIPLRVGVSAIAQEKPYFDGCFGPEIGFALRMDKNNSQMQIAIIKYAEGATGIARSHDYHDFKSGFESFDDKGKNWYPSKREPGLLYSNMINDIKDALSVLRQGKRKFEIVGFIWMQGEHEAGINEKMAQDYGTLLTSFRDAVRHDLNVRYLPFTIGEINSHSWAFAEIARNRQSEACRNDSRSILIKTTDIPRGGIGGEAHFTADGMLMLGERFADGMIQFLIKKTNSGKK